MGLLDDLKKQAEAKKATEQQAALSQQEREQYYQEVLHPGMLSIYNYLNEMISHLNYLAQPTIAQYPLLPGKEKIDLNQGHYKIVIDSTQTTKNITLSFECRFPNLLEVDVKGKDRIEDYTDTLNNYKVRYERRDKKDEDFKLLEACFKVEGPVFASVTFTGDVEQSRINLFLRNVEKPGLVKHILKSDHLHDDFLDRLANYLIRESDDFLKLDIDETAKQQIRKNLEAANKQREQELIEAEKRLQEEQEAEKNKRTRFDTLIEKLKPKK